MNNDIKVALCCIAKLENNYIIEFIEHYLNLGFNKIYIYDNNDIDGEQFNDKILDYINNGTVVVINKRGLRVQQFKVYSECYDEYKYKYDYICFFDCDEFLILNKHNTIQEYLSQPKFNNYNLICINWQIYDDNELLYYENIPVKERFTHKISYNLKYYNIDPPRKANSYFKTIAKCINNYNIKFYNAHTGILDNSKRCNSIGEEIILEDYDFNMFDDSLVNLDEAYLAHYTYKTAEEYKLKMYKGNTDYDYNGYTKELFFMINRYSKEKENILDNFNVS